MDATRLQAEYDACEAAICDLDTPAADRLAALQRVTELRAPLKAATDKDIASLLDATIGCILEES